jgi:hypothetical protein
MEKDDRADRLAAARARLAAPQVELALCLGEVLQVLELPWKTGTNPALFRTLDANHVQHDRDRHGVQPGRQPPRR